MKKADLNFGAFTHAFSVAALLFVATSPILSNQSLGAGNDRSVERPNAIIFIADDVSWNDYGCYGNAAARTPNIDALAVGGIRFDNAYLTASSCSPSRSSIITGRYPHNNGSAAELHKPISAHLPWFPQLLRDAGYYTALSGKHHMKSTEPKTQPTVFDHVDGGRGPGNSGGHANWVSVTEKRPKDKPFFFWFASYDAHRGWDSDKQWDAEAFGPMHKPADVKVSPFLVDDLATRQDLASYYNEVTRFDHYIGRVVDMLREQDALDNTLIFVLADNGRPFPRAKTRLHDSGMKTALVAHWPKRIKHSAECDSLVSVIDLAPTILSAAGVPVAKTMQGVSLLPVLENPEQPVRQYAFSEHNWHDYEALGRSVRHGDFLLIKNSRPEQAWQGPADSVRSPSHKSLLEGKRNNGLTTVQNEVLMAPRPEFELYHFRNDPNQLNNLAGDSKYASTKQQLAWALDQWMEETGDSVPAKINPDIFHRETGNRLPKSQINDKDAITPGADRGADKINTPGPR